ncbi:MAG: hypothetical protein E7422_02085 [Ruminococcaceae bacterium]|nr:hypothetical protein [Oscillospiraceae bacterium]
MSIESLGMHRSAGPARTERAARPERKGPGVPPPGRGFDAAEVRGDRPQPPRASDTKAMLGKLHERGLLTNVSRPLGPDGQPIQTDGRGYGRAWGETAAASQPEMDEIPEQYRRRIHEAVVKFGEREFGNTQQPQESAPEGRVYGRPRPQPPRPPEGARRDSGVFTIKLYSPARDTGKTLRIGDHVIPLEEDGSILAGMPDGTVRRITFDQKVMDEMVARGEVWMEGDEPNRPVEADYAGAGTEGFNDMQKKLIRKAYDLLKRQAEIAKAAGFDNMPRHAPAATKEQEQLVGEGRWSVDSLTKEIMDYAKELADGDAEKFSQLRDAFVRAHANYAIEHGNGGTQGVTAQTFSETLAELDKLAAPARERETGVSGEVSVQAGAENAPKPHGDTAANERTGKGNPALVAQLKAELEHRQAEMLKLVRDMLGKQGKNVAGDGVWRVLASGDFQVDAKTKAEAQKNIAEDGYWGVEQTSDRIVRFAVGLAGASPEMLDKMEEAFEKGYAEAEKTWGSALPEITQQTRARVHEKFEELRKQQNNGATNTAENGGAGATIAIVQAQAE